MSPPEAPATPARPPWLRAAIDYAGIAAFAVAFFATRSMLTATWALVAVSAVALAVGFAVERRIAPSPLIWGLAALVFGVLTLVFHDPRIIKMKTTFIDVALGLFLLGGYAIGKSPVKMLMGDALAMSDQAWRRLTWRYGAFFLVMAVLNEIVWRTQPDKVWVLFRFPGLVVLALGFSATQVPGMMKDASAMEAAVRLSELQE